MAAFKFTLKKDVFKKFYYPLIFRKIKIFFVITQIWNVCNVKNLNIFYNVKINVII